MIVGGQVKGSEPRLFMIYPEGNFIEAGDRHALSSDRRDEIRPADPGARFDRTMSFEAAVKLLLSVSIRPSRPTSRSGLPLDLELYEGGSLKRGLHPADHPRRCLFPDDFQRLGDALKRAFDSLPDVVL